MIAHFTRTFSAAHRIADDPSPCHRIHGHNYHVKIKVETDGERIMVVPHGIIKNIVDFFDHMLILQHSDPLVRQLREAPVVWNSNDSWIYTTTKPPTTENLAQLIADEIAQETVAYQQDVLNAKFSFAAVTIFLTETASITAEAYSVRTRVTR